LIDVFVCVLDVSASFGQWRERYVRPARPVYGSSHPTAGITGQRSRWCSLLWPSDCVAFRRRFQPRNCRPRRQLSKVRYIPLFHLPFSSELQTNVVTGFFLYRQ